MKNRLKTTLAAAIVLLVLGGIAWTAAYGLGARPAQVFNDDTLDLPKGVRMDFGSGVSITSGSRQGFGGGKADSAVSPGGVYTVSAEGIDSIGIEWLAGSARVVITDGSSITITESSGGGISEENALRCSTQDGALSIRYCAGPHLSASLYSKDLVLGIPASLAETLTDFAFSSASASLEVPALNLSGRFKLDSVSGVLTADGIRARTVSIDTSSGSVTFSNGSADQISVSTVSGGIKVLSCLAKELEIDSSSGKVEVSGEFTKIDADTVSGSVALDCGACPRKLEVETSSGGVTLSLPKGSGFTVEYDTVSGSFRCGFAAVSRGDRHTVGSGGAEFSVDTISGNLTILEK